MSVVPRCTNSCPGRAYPRSSLLCWANQTEPGYTLTGLASRDKAVRVLGRSVLVGEPLAPHLQPAAAGREKTHLTPMQGGFALGWGHSTAEPLKHLRVLTQSRRVLACRALSQALPEQLCSEPARCRQRCRQRRAAAPAPRVREAAGSSAWYHPAHSLPGLAGVLWCPRHGFRRRLLNPTSCSAA